MPTTLTFNPATPRHRRKRRAAPKVIVPQTPLNLSAATYPSATLLVLTFARPVNVAGFNVTTVTVVGAGGTVYTGTGFATVVNPTKVNVPLVAQVYSQAGPVRFSVAAGNGVVAADDGAPWAGVTDVLLPFP